MDFLSNTKKFTINNLSLQDAENFPKLYWFEKTGSIGKKKSYSKVNKILNFDNPMVKVIPMRDDYYYRSKDLDKCIVRKKGLDPYIAKFTRTCPLMPEFNISIKIYPVPAWYRFDSTIDEKFKAVIENQNYRYLNKSYIDILEKIEEISARRKKLKICD